eukprot:scaffold196684_cov20-Tisochrysis_lutea.AAC.1
MCLPRWQPLLQGSPGSPERRQCHPRLALQLGGPGCKHAGHGSPMAPVRAHLQAGGCVCEPQHRHGAQPARGAGKGRGGMPIWPGCLEPLFATLLLCALAQRPQLLHMCGWDPWQLFTLFARESSQLPRARVHLTWHFLEAPIDHAPFTRGTNQAHAWLFDLPWHFLTFFVDAVS